MVIFVTRGRPDGRGLNPAPTDRKVLVGTTFWLSAH